LLIDPCQWRNGWGECGTTGHRSTGKCPFGEAWQFWVDL